MSLQQPLTDHASPGTSGLIGSDKVDGSAVFATNGACIGKIDRVMIDKLSGRVAYAVLRVDGAYDIAPGNYPIPWSLLTYNAGLGGYEIELSEQLLSGAPKFAAGQSWEYETRGQEDQLFRYYNTPPYWA